MEHKELLKTAAVHFDKTYDRIGRLAAHGLMTSQRSRAKRSEIVEQARVLCEDYVYCRVQGLYHRTAADGPTDDCQAGGSDSDIDYRAEEVCAVSKEIQEVGARLELTYPSLYVDLSRHLCMPLRSQVAVRKALVCIGDYMFRGQPPVITWCRIVGLFAVAAAIARECVVNGNQHLIPTVITTFTELVDRYLAVWIHRQGGWRKVLKEFNIHSEVVQTKFFMASFGAAIAFIFTWLLVPSIV